MSRDVRVEGRRIIRAPLHRVWQIVSHPETHPRHVSLWLAADVIERTQSALLVEYRGLFGGLPVTSVQRVTLRPPGRVEFRQLRGTLLSLTGAFTLKDAQGETDLTLVLAVDAGIALLSETAVQQILAGGIESTLSKLKATAERELVRVVVRRSQTGAEAEPPAEAEDESDQAGGSVAAPDGAGAAAQVEAPDAGKDDDTEQPDASTPSTPAAATAARPEGQRRRRRRRRRRGGGPRPAAPGA